MLEKVREWWNKGYRDLSSYADTRIECVALYFIAMWYVIYKIVSAILLFVIAPIWITPYCIYKSRKEKKSNGKVGRDIDW